MNALRCLGYDKDEMTIHGFRGMASTLLNECGKYRRDVIEAQLAHGKRNKVRGAYNHAEYLPERRVGGLARQVEGGEIGIFSR